MSTHAPWLALACDWHESEMFKGTTAKQKLAFIALLCFSKSRGRAGRVTLRPHTLCSEFGITEADLAEMLKRAVKHGAIEIDGSTVRFVNWSKYQDPSQRKGSLVKDGSFRKKSATKDQGPITRDQSPGTKEEKKPPIPPKGGVSILKIVEAESVYGYYPRKVGKAAALKAIAKALAVIRQRPDAPGDPVTWLIDRVAEFARSPAGNAGGYTPYPSTWFNQGRYDDDPAEWNREATTGPDGCGPSAIDARRADKVKGQFPPESGEARLL